MKQFGSVIIGSHGFTGLLKSPIRYKRVALLGMDIIEAYYKGVVMSLGFSEEGVIEPWMSIYSMESANEGRGECQEMIVQLKKDFPNVRWYASVPLCDAAEHILRKHNISFSYDELGTTH